MEDRKFGLLRTVRQMNIGTAVSAAGFLLYLVASGVGATLLADIIAIVFGVMAIYVWLSVWEGRKKDKETVSYNLLWGQSALTIMLVGCAVLAIRMYVSSFL